MEVIHVKKVFSSMTDNSPMASNAMSSVQNIVKSLSFRYVFFLNRSKKSRLDLVDVTLHIIICLWVVEYNKHSSRRNTRLPPKHIRAPLTRRVNCVLLQHLNSRITPDTKDSNTLTRESLSLNSRHISMDIEFLVEQPD